MARLFGAQRLVLQEIQDAQGESQSFLEDTRICQATKISLRDMRDWFLTLDNDEYVDLALTESGLSASVTAKGRLALGLYRPFPTPTTSEPSRSRSKTGGRGRWSSASVTTHRPSQSCLPSPMTCGRWRHCSGRTRAVPRPECPPPDRRRGNLAEAHRSDRDDFRQGSAGRCRVCIHGWARCRRWGRLLLCRT